jgi:hypothetical protein
VSKKESAHTIAHFPTLSPRKTSSTRWAMAVSLRTS